MDLLPIKSVGRWIECSKSVKPAGEGAATPDGTPTLLTGLTQRRFPKSLKLARAPFIHSFGALRRTIERILIRSLELVWNELQPTNTISCIAEWPKREAQ